MKKINYFKKFEEDKKEAEKQIVKIVIDLIKKYELDNIAVIIDSSFHQVFITKDGITIYAEVTTKI